LLKAARSAAVARLDDWQLVGQVQKEKFQRIVSRTLSSPKFHAVFLVES
jgi:hypothetical protein